MADDVIEADAISIDVEAEVIDPAADDGMDQKQENGPVDSINEDIQGGNTSEMKVEQSVEESDNKHTDDNEEIGQSVEESNNKHPDDNEEIGQSVEESNDKQTCGEETEGEKCVDPVDNVDNKTNEMDTVDDKNLNNVNGETGGNETEDDEMKEVKDEDDDKQKDDDGVNDDENKKEHKDKLEVEEKLQVMNEKSEQSAASSIDVKIVRIKDLDVDDAKSHSSRPSEKTFMTAIADDNVSIAPTIDEVQAELDRVLSRQTAEDNLLPNQLPGRTATRNTPATPMTEYTNRTTPVRSGTKLTLASLPSATKDTIYQRALALMDTRCSSRTKSFGDTGTSDHLPLLVPNIPDHPYRHFPDSYFYVTQQRPLPAAPVKAWRGYHGNVYFEPLTCRRLDTAPVYRDKSFYNSMVLKSRGTRSVTFSPKKEILNRHHYKRTTTKKPGTRQMALLDKTSVIQRMDENVQEDVQWISGMESLGTLRVGRALSPSTASSATTERDRYDKMKICRGFVSRNATQFQTLPVVPIKGGRLTHPVPKSQYLTSQYRGSSRQGLISSRMSNDGSPDLYGFPTTPIPSLDKLQASLQNVEKSREMVFSIPSYTSIPTTDDSTPRSPKTNAVSYHGDKNTKLQSY